MKTFPQRRLLASTFILMLVSAAFLGTAAVLHAQAPFVWTGVWKVIVTEYQTDNKWGEEWTLAQTDDVVTGQGVKLDYSDSTHIDGRVSGRTLEASFVYSSAPSLGEYPFRVEMSSDGWSFTGFWKWSGYGRVEWEGTLEGKRSTGPINTQTTTQRRIGLCEKAFAVFGDRLLETSPVWSGDVEDTKIHKDYADLLADMQLAISKYDKEQQEKFGGEARLAYTSAPETDIDGLDTGRLKALNWVADEEGLMARYHLPDGDKLSSEFAFNNEKDATNAQGGFGTEPALQRAIVSMAQSEDRRLAPGDVLYLALYETGGDTRQAMLLAHNTLRSMARPGSQQFTGVPYEPNFASKYLEPIRGDPILRPVGQTDERDSTTDTSDRFGPWYHLFGTAYYEMQFRGSTAGVGTYIFYGLTSPVNPGAYRALLDATIRIWAEAMGKEFDPTYASEIALLVEEYQKAKGDKPQPLDPEKFCFNWWGAKIGRELYVSFSDIGLVREGVDGAQKPGDTYNMPQSALMEASPVQGSELAVASDSTDEVSLDDLPLEEISPYVDHPGARLFTLRSPLSVTWKADGRSMLFDQTAAGLFGYFPNILIPIYDGTNWGAVWFDFARDQHSMNLEAAQDGGANLISVDMENGKGAAYSFTVQEGDTLSMEITPDDSVPGLVRADGTTINPQIIDVGTGSTSTVIKSEPVLILEVTSLGAVSSDPLAPTTFTVDWPLAVTQIRTYHWNDGSGTSTPGTIELVDETGTTYGPWQATGEAGSNGVPNVYWVVEPNVELSPGEYRVVDSDSSTWSWNEETEGRGITWVYARLQTQLMQTSETTLSQTAETGLPGGYITIAAVVLLAAAAAVVLLRRQMRRPPQNPC